MCRLCVTEAESPFLPSPVSILYPLHSRAPQLWSTLPTSAEKHLPTSGFSPLPLKRLVLKSLQRVVIFPLWRLAQLEKVSFCTEHSRLFKSIGWQKQQTVLRFIQSGQISAQKLKLQLVFYVVCGDKKKGRYLTAPFGDAKLMLVSDKVSVLVSMVDYCIISMNPPSS